MTTPGLKCPTVAFSGKNEIQYFKSSSQRRTRRWKNHLKMEETTFKKYKAEDVTDSMIQEAAKLFSENYGIWGKDNKYAKPGQLAQTHFHLVYWFIGGSRVRLSPERLRSQYLDIAQCFYVRATVDGKLAGNAFACHWLMGDKTVCWITQLVVDSNYRQRGLAKGLLNQLKQQDVDIYGLMSSHPAACLAAVKAFGG
jgi:GNAT superfamily N-acetyltransferase